jgi:nucleotidyltransferase substrate binding protein (TIGR01987 family)
MAGEKVDRFDLQLEHFQKSLARLNEALAEDETSFVRDSIIKRFEVTFEMAWKTVYRYLLDKGERLAPTAWDVIPKAFQYTLIEDADLWNEMRAFRNDTSHEYNEAKAIEIAAFVRAGGVQALEKLEAEMLSRA